MRIMAIDETPIQEILFQAASSRGKPETRRLPVLRGRCDRLPDGISALLITSDLQGIAPSWSSGGEARLLGEVLADHVYDLASDMPELSNLAVILCGDLFSAPDAAERGATGDVTSVWRAFSEISRWVVGIQGNHDTFPSSFANLGNCTLLDDSVMHRDGFSIGGVGLIAGNPEKRGRRLLHEQSDAIRRVSSAMPDLVLVHEGPPGQAHDQKGSAHVLEALHPEFAGTVVAGHCHWGTPTSTFNKSGLLNVDSRALIVTL